MIPLAYCGPANSPEEATFIVKKYRYTFTSQKVLVGQEAAFTSNEDMIIHYYLEEDVIAHYDSMTGWLMVLLPEIPEDPKLHLLNGIAQFFQFKDYASAPTNTKQHIRTLAAEKQVKQGEKK